MISLIDNTCKASPIIIIIILCFYSFMNNIKWPMYLNIFLIIGDLSNHYLLKNGLFKILYIKFGYKNHRGELTLPLLGIYNRPKNAKNCGLFNNDNYSKNISRGMSSGHSQLIFTFTIFLIRYFKDIKDKYSIIKSIILLAISILIALSRVYLAKCHTLQQIIIGSFVGFGYGYYIFYIFKSIDFI